LFGYPEDSAGEFPVALRHIKSHRNPQGRLDNPKSSDEAENEFGKDVSPPTCGWTGLSRPLELAIAAGPLLLFKPTKLSANRFSRARLLEVSLKIAYHFVPKSYLESYLAVVTKTSAKEYLHLVS